jgi:hypothetical protein
MSKQYKITKKFIKGVLKGITITEVTPVKFEIGKVYGPKNGSRFEIVNMKEV